MSKVFASVIRHSSCLCEHVLCVYNLSLSFNLPGELIILPIFFSFSCESVAQKKNPSAAAIEAIVFTLQMFGPCPVVHCIYAIQTNLFPRLLGIRVRRFTRYCSHCQPQLGTRVQVSFMGFGSICIHGCI